MSFLTEPAFPEFGPTVNCGLCFIQFCKPFNLPSAIKGIACRHRHHFHNGFAFRGPRVASKKVDCRIWQPLFQILRRLQQVCSRQTELWEHRWNCLEVDCRLTTFRRW